MSSTPDAAVVRSLHAITQQLASLSAQEDIAAYLKTLPAPLFGIATPMSPSAQSKQNIRRDLDGGIAVVEDSTQAMSGNQNQL